MMARLITGDALTGELPRDDSWFAPGRDPIAVTSRSVLAWEFVLRTRRAVL